MKFRFKEFFEQNKELTQLFYGVVLILLIVGLVAFNSFYIINKFKSGFDSSTRFQAAFFGKTVYSILKEDLDNDLIIQNRIKNIINGNKDIKNISVLKEVDDGKFEIVASTLDSSIGKITSFFMFRSAWSFDEGQSIATDSINTKLTDSATEKEMMEEVAKSGRHWFVALPMFDKNNQRTAILSVLVSSELVDGIIKTSHEKSIINLSFIIVVVILFLGLTLRLWDYVLLYKKTKQVDQMKDEFISIASHELRTPVTGIKGFTSMLLDGNFGELNIKMIEPLNMIKGASERLVVLVEDLLNVSRIEQGKISIDKQAIEPNELINQIINELDVQAKQKKLKLFSKYHKLILPKINIDSDRFKQIVINLVGNSIKYTNTGSVEIVTSELKDGKLLEIKIKDTGIGMTAEERDRLFQKFYRVKNEETAKITGTGLGLWITKQLVELMGGKIYIDSMKGVGSQVSITFPIIK